MESRTRIMISVLTAFFVSFSALVLFLDFYQPTHLDRYKNFFSGDLGNGKKLVFLVGASHVGQLNATLINQIVSARDSNYIVYNIADSEDTPQIRLRTMSYIINAKPSLVIYGISYRDFSTTNNPNPLLPDPSTSIKNFLGLENYDNYFEKFSFPLLTTLTFIKNETSETGLISKGTEEVIPYTPFYSYPPSLTKILNDKELESEARLNVDVSGSNIPLPSQNYQLMALEKIIEKLHKNKIKVVVFVTPLHQSYINDLSDDQKQSFVDIINDIKKEPIAKVYDLSNKYEDLPIWANPSHVSYNENSMIYSDDVAKIILDEIGP